MNRNLVAWEVFYGRSTMLIQMGCMMLKFCDLHGWLTFLAGSFRYGSEYIPGSHARIWYRGRTIANASEIGDVQRGFCFEKDVCAMPQKDVYDLEQISTHH